MVLEAVSAIILPIILIPFLARVTYNRWVSIALAVIIMVVLFKNFESFWTIIAGVVGVLVGSYFSLRIGKKVDKKWS
ncbi:DUF2198 family protein [Pseudalkalibacillus sp. SCS-8]|uniref:DUF2198 family protein n=1 Tax=Pseudalkalibacillus nanhaiensis TaxID=3115291 RepID=UPI0032DB9A45